MSNLAKIVNDLQTQRKRVRRDLIKLDAALAALRGGAGAKLRKPRRAMSAAARRKIAAAQRARWAKWKTQKKAA
jgi:DeoR/GlpR family transcriptional regulator of sugar metabolism